MSLLASASSKARFMAEDSIGRLFGRRVRYVTNGDLRAMTLELLPRLPEGIERIIYIPDSGIIPAAILGERLGIPFDPITTSLPSGELKVLLVDDTVNTGQTMRRNIRLLRAFRPEYEVVTAAPIVSRGYAPVVEHYSEALPRDRILEWELAKSNFGQVASDMDGVLCENAPVSDYIQWIEGDPRPRLLPEYELAMVLTARQEEHRARTEAWLKGHGVRYRELHMGLAFGQRIRLIRRHRPRIDLILESDESHARKLWNATKIPVLCTDANRVFCRGCGMARSSLEGDKP